MAIVAIIKNGKGEKIADRFDSEEELRYFLTCNEDCKIIEYQFVEDN